MAPRRRKDINRGLPPNLRCRRGYYSYRNPETGVEFGIGRSRQLAIIEAVKANAHLASKRVSLVERISGKGITWADWCDTFERLLARRDLAANTIRSNRSKLKRLRTLVDENKAASAVDTKDCARAIEGLILEGKHRMAQSFRSFLGDCFDRMIAQGIRKDNPATVTDEISVKVKRARLELDVFMRVYRLPSISAMLRNAMALSIVTSQAREECCAALVTDVKEGDLWIDRKKTRRHDASRVRIPLELRLDCFGMSLGDVVKQCRSTGVLSRHLLHRVERAKGAKVGTPVHVDVLTREFTAAIDSIGIDYSPKKAPTFHEIRSLSGRLYEKQGNVNPQELFGHKDPSTTATYLDHRGEWLRVSIRK
jgi:integrase